MSAHYAMCKYDDATGSYIPLSDGMAVGFEKWFASYAPYAPESLDDCALDAYQAGASSQDAEVNDWRSQAHRTCSQPHRKEKSDMELVEQLRTWDEIPDDDAKAFHWLDLKTAEAADLIEKQAAELEAARAEIERKMSAGQFVLEQLADEQAKNVGLRELVKHFALIDLGRSLLPDDFGLWVLRARKALSTPDDLSSLRAHDAAIWREAMQIAEDSRDKATMSKYSSVPECRAARDMAECLSKAYCHKADAIEK